MKGFDEHKDFDLREYEKQIKRRRLMKAVIVLAIAYFIGLFIVALIISKKEVRFSTETYGYKQLKIGKPSVMSFRVLDFHKTIPHQNFRVKASIVDDKGMKIGILDSVAKDETDLIVPFTVPDALPPGQYTLEVEFSSELGKETAKIPIELVKKVSGVEVAVSTEKPDAWTRPNPVPVTELGNPAFRIEIIPENGRVAYELRQKFFFVARTRTGEPIPGIRVMIAPDDKPEKKIADFITDDAGMGSFKYAVPLGSGKFRITLVKMPEKDVQKLLKMKEAYKKRVERLRKAHANKARRYAKPFVPPKFSWPKPNPKKHQIVEKTFVVGPKGTHLHISPDVVVINNKEKKPTVSLKLQTMFPNRTQYVDLYKNGIWLEHWEITPKRKKSSLGIPLFQREIGIYQIQASTAVGDVQSDYDAVYVYSTGKKDPNKFIAVVSDYLDKHRRMIDKAAYDEWKLWAKNVVAYGRNYDPEEVIRVGFSMMKKRYYIPPLLYASRTDKVVKLQAEMEKDRSMLLWMMGFSGALVIFLLLMSIIKEFSRRKQELAEMAENASDEEIEEQELAYSVAKGRIVSLSILLVILTICYILMIWYLVNLDWGSSWSLMP